MSVSANRRVTRMFRLMGQLIGAPRSSAGAPPAAVRAMQAAHPPQWTWQWSTPQWTQQHLRWVGMEEMPRPQPWRRWDYWEGA